MDVTVLEVTNVVDEIAVTALNLRGGGAVTEEHGVAGFKAETVLVVVTDDVSS